MTPQNPGVRGPNKRPSQRIPDSAKKSLLEEFSSSSLSLLNFCREKQIAPTTFRQWHKKFSPQKNPNKSQRFIPVNVFSDDKAEVSGIPPESPIDFRLHFGDSLSLSIKPGFHVPTLKRIVKTLSSRGGL